VFVSSADDLPPADGGGVRQLAGDTAYLFTRNVDIGGYRIVGGENTAILGLTSEVSSLTSTGLGAGVPLFASQWTTTIQNITIRDVDTGFSIDNNGGAGGIVALDWRAVNFENVPNVGVIGDVANFIFESGALLNSRGLRFTGHIGTVGIFNSLFVGDGESGNVVELASSATVTRRFRVIYSSFVAPGSTTALRLDSGATVPTESLILEQCNFSGEGVALAGVVTSNSTLYERNVGIANTGVVGRLGMAGNASATTISDTTSFVKAAGTTSPSPLNEKFGHDNNRLTFEGAIQRKYRVTAIASFTSGTNQEIELGIFDGTEVVPTSVTGASSGVGGRVESAACEALVFMVPGDFVEVHVKNRTSATNVTVTNLSLTATAI